MRHGGAAASRLARAEGRGTSRAARDATGGAREDGKEEATTMVQVLADQGWQGQSKKSCKNCHGVADLRQIWFKTSELSQTEK